MKRPGDLPARVAVAVVGIPLVFGALYAGGWVLGAAIALVAALGAWEFYGLLRLRGDHPFASLGIAASAGLVIVSTGTADFGTFAPLALAVLIALTGASLALSLFFRWPGGSPAGALGSTVAGALYVGLPLAFLPLLRAVGDRAVSAGASGAWVPMAFVLLPLLVIWASDTAAYFVGIAVGRIRLAPSVSPKKSVEGALAGVLGGVGAAALVSRWWLADLAAFGVPVGTALGFGAALSVAGQVGDLVESVLKREAGVKDSSGLLPGHGGFLDRLDGLLFAFPVAWGLLAVTGVLP